MLSAGAWNQSIRSLTTIRYANITANEIKKCFIINEINCPCVDFAYEDSTPGKSRLDIEQSLNNDPPKQTVKC